MGKARSTAGRIWLGAAICLAAGLLINGVPAGATGMDGGPSITAVPVTARYSPLGATGSTKFTAGQHVSPPTAVVLTPTAVITDAESQWTYLGLPWDNTAVSGVTVCYSITTAVVGRSYITQTRLTSMTLPNAAFVMLDDGTDRTAVGPVCYTVPAGFATSGTLTLSLRVVFGSTADRIMLGMIAVSGTSE